MTREQEQAIIEVKSKTLRQIQTETAVTWAYRAWAAYALSGQGVMIGGRAGLSFYHDAVEFEHEAVEHAALCGDDNVLVVVRNIVKTGEPG